MNATGSSHPNQSAPAPRLQTPPSFARNAPPADPAATGGQPVPVYATLEVVRHAVPMGAAPLRQHTAPQAPRQPDQKAGHFQNPRSHPTPLQIPPSNHPANAQNLFTQNTHQPPPSAPSRTPQEFYMSPVERNPPPPGFPKTARRQSDPAHPTPTHAENPQTPTQPPAFDPLIISATDIALAPVRAALDTVWNLSVNNMRLAMNKMNNDFTYLATQERHRNNHLASKVNSLESHLQAARQDIQLMRKERQELQNIVQAYKDQNRKLHSEKEHWEIERRVLMEGRHGIELPRIDMDKVLGAVTEQVSKEISSIMDQMEEQKSSRIQAERRLSETLQHLSDIQKRDSCQSSPVLHQSPFVLPPSLQRAPSHSPTSTCVVSPILSTAGKSPQPGAADAASTPTRSTTPATILTTTTPAEIIPTGDSPSVIPTAPSPARNNSLRRTTSFEEQQQPRKRPRLMDEGEDRYPPSAVDAIDESESENVSPEPKGTEGAPASVTVKPEPLEVDMAIERPEEATTPSSPPSTRATPVSWTPARKPTPMPHRTSVPNVLPANNQRTTKLGIGHIDLLYRTDNGVMTCRMCLSRSRDLLLSRDRSSKVSPVKKFEQTQVSWDELIAHCKGEHGKTCRDLEKLGAAQIAEMKQRLVSGEKSTIARG